MSVQGRMAQVLRALEDRPMTSLEVERALQMSRNYVYYCLKKLKDEGRVHICGWAKSPTSPRRIFKKGPGKDAEKPAAGGPVSKAKPDSVRYLAIRKLADMGIHISEKSSVAEVSKAIELVMPRGDNLITLHVELFVKPPVAPPSRFRNMERKEWRPGTHLRATEIAAHPRMWTPRTIIASGFQLQGGFD